MVKTRLYQKCCIKTVLRADRKLVITNKKRPKGRLRLLTKSYYKLKLRHSRESGNLVINNLLFLLIFWIPAFAGMTSSLLELIPNSVTKGVCQQSEATQRVAFLYQPLWNLYGYYLPIQKLEKITPSKSSEVNSPVMVLSCSCARRSSSANKSSF